MNTTVFIKTLSDEFKRKGHPKIAAGQKAYMRGQFEFFGIKTEDRRKIQKPFLAKSHLPEKSELQKIVHALWSKTQRDFQLFGQELTAKYVNQIDKKDIALFEYMVQNKSWWDTVDFIAVHLMGSYFRVYPEQRKTYIKKWINSNNIWMQRSALLFQLKYKSEIDTTLLSTVIDSLLGSKEFFINKAIGWVLREYSKTNPQWVCHFIQKTSLDPLSKREGLRLLK